MAKGNFPIHSGSVREFPDGPRSLPWEIVEAHRAQIESNHSQSLEQLAERGGLGYEELYVGLRDVSLAPLFRHEFTHQQAYDFVISKISEASARERR